MKQYLELLKEIKEKGVYKPPAREGMPGTQSLFGYQFRHNLSEGFPLLTTKKMFWKGIVIELLWFLRGDTNIKYLIDNGVNIWNEDAYNYYLKVGKQKGRLVSPVSFDGFITEIRNHDRTDKEWFEGTGYKLGDCGFQYGKVWRNWDKKVYEKQSFDCNTMPILVPVNRPIDQIKNVINSLKNSPESRRHIVTAIDPAHDQDLALYWCHAMFQFNCRPVGDEVYEIAGVMYDDWEGDKDVTKGQLWEMGYPKYYLDCQLYQRSADAILGVPFNIASYALLTHIICKIVNMIPGEFIHTFGDVHIYDNHKEAVEEQLSRTPDKLPTLNIPDKDVPWETWENCMNWHWSNFTEILRDYNPQPSIKAELSTGLKK